MSQSSTQFGPYELLYQLGTGGMGEVFLARQRGEHGIQRLVAIKRLLSHLNQQKHLVRLFLDEVRLVAQLNHGNIVQVIDHGQVDGQHYMAMEYVHGENLMAVIDRLDDSGMRVPVDLALHLASSVCEGLDYAHGKESLQGKPLGIVHRDITPHNILLSFQGEVKLADFGVARAAEQTHETLGGELKGKLAYMSPEQATGKPLDHRSDLYSLGVVLYEALSGRNPLRRDNSMATLEAVRDPGIPSLALLQPELSPEVVQLVQWTLSPRPADRPASARQLHEALQKIVRAQQLSISPFALADTLRELFPESGPQERNGDADATAVGRRADDDLDNQARKTLWYLRQRRPDHDATVDLTPQDRGTGGGTLQREGDTAVGPPTDRGRLGLWLLGLCVLALVGGGVTMALRRAPARSLVLTPDAGGGARAQLTSDAAPRPDQQLRAALKDRKPDAAPRRPPPRAPATLVIRSTPPGAWVKVQGRLLADVTPLRHRLSAGRYSCSVGLRNHKPWSTALTLRAGKSTTLEPRLKPLRASLNVRSTLACRVTVNRTQAGETPLTGYSVAPGRAEVTCVNTSAGVRQTRRVRVSPGQTNEVQFRFGVLNVNVEPWASVTVDGRPRGSTPLRLHLAEGGHRLVLRNKEKQLQRQRTVEIKANSVHRISSW